MHSESPLHAGRLRAAAATRKVRLSLTRGNTSPEGDRPANARLGARLGSPEFPRPLGVPAEAVPALELVR
jgi:hypothetical protein